MIGRLKALLTGAEEALEREHSADELHLAAAVLLVEAARMDDCLDPAELERVGELVRWRFGLETAEAEALIDAARDATAGSVQLYGFTRTVRERFSQAERVQLIEMMWDVAYADGSLHELEAQLLRRMTGMLNVSDQDSGAARKRAMRRHHIDEPGSTDQP